MTAAGYSGARPSAEMGPPKKVGPARRAGSDTYLIPGPPAGQGSLRFLGKGRKPLHPDSLLDWRARASIALTGGTPHTGRVAVVVRAYFTRPKTHLRADGTIRMPAWSKWPTLDLDKVQRACGDALQAAGIVNNDSQIARWTASKGWGNTTVPEGVVLTITDLDPQEVLP